MRFAVVVAVLACGACNRAPEGDAVPAGDAIAPVQITNSTRGAYEAALATRADGFVAAWYDNRDGNAEIYMRLLDGAGQPAGPERRLTNGPEESYEPSIESVGNGVAIAWYDKSSDGGLVPKLGVWDLDGRSRWMTPLADKGRNPVVSTFGGDIFCAWISPGPDGAEWVWGGWWRVSGEHDPSPRRLARASKTTWNLNVGASDFKGAWVVFDATAGTRADEVFLVSLGPSSITTRRLTSDDGIPSKYPDFAGDLAGALTWFDERDGNKEVYLFVTTAIFAFEGEIDHLARRVTTTPGESIGAYLDWAESAPGEPRRLGLAWSDDSTGQHEVYFQAFDARPAPLGPPRRITRTPTSSLIPAIRPWRGGFALAWNEFKPGAEAHEGTSEIAFAIVR